MNNSYRHKMYQLWEGDPDHLKERVGAKQFSTEMILKYAKNIFLAGRPYCPDPGRRPKVGDYGCGIGRLTIPFAFTYDLQVYGFDISEDMVEEANRRCREEYPEVASQVIHRQCAGDGVPIEGVLPGYEVPELDFIYSVITLQHICSRRVIEDIFWSFRMILRRGGKFAIQVKKWEPHLRPWDYEPPENGIPEVLPLFTSLPERYHVEEGNAYTEDQITGLLVQEGLRVDRIVETEPIDDHGRWLWVYGDRP